MKRRRREMLNCNDMIWGFDQVPYVNWFGYWKLSTGNAQQFHSNWLPGSIGSSCLSWIQKDSGLASESAAGDALINQTRKSGEQVFQILTIRTASTVVCLHLSSFHKRWLTLAVLFCIGLFMTASTLVDHLLLFSYCMPGSLTLQEG